MPAFALLPAARPRRGGRLRLASALGALVLVPAASGHGGGATDGPSPQNPSPMVDRARPHPRLLPGNPPGLRRPLSLGSLFVPAEATADVARQRLPLILHFHGAAWLAEEAAASLGEAALVSFQLGSGSQAYARPFAEDPRRWQQIVREAEQATGRPLGPIVLSGWSAGYGAIREILQQREGGPEIAAAVLLDGLHAAYATERPEAGTPELAAESLAPFLLFAREAAAERTALLVLHTEIFPGTYASTTETADYLLDKLGLTRRAVLRWGPLGMQQLSEAGGGRFRVGGYAGNSAPDHVDLLHAAATFWREALELAGLAEAAASDWRPLFDGGTLAGWEGPSHVFRVAEGALVGGSLQGPVPRNEFLCTRQTFENFELHFEARLTGAAGRNAGVQFRSARVPDSHEVAGYQCDLAVHAGRPVWGWIYDESRRNRFLAPAGGDPSAEFTAQLALAVRDGDWNAYAIRCRGSRVQTWVNGYPAADYQETDPAIARRGVIGLQIHGGPPSEAWYRNLRIREWHD